ncbi:hypothetical protein AURDEDRAFT_117327 [Auricularia subglabra TFB-10046 SS5]|uniref:Uncharacterized protein n=1 Tax=Auricularia subglabra (strain TFB-10046 / SS5) TaxID=717982 RepID=J0CXQ7_AURST|nr:hypothetical protein AURDEDRAFT_117327 [Auricularia subglabra TFB-10046 SS5]
MFPLGLFRHFPALSILSVHGGPCLGAEPSDATARQAIAPQLAAFAVEVIQCDHLALFGAVPHLASIPAVKCREPHIDLMRILLDHLYGPLELGVMLPTYWENEIEVAFSAPKSERLRVFVEDSTRIQSDWPRDIVFAPDLAERVTALRLTASLAYLVPLFAELPTCTTLSLQVGNKDDLLGLPPATLALPALKSVVVRSRAEHVPVIISAETLREFLVCLVGTRTVQPTLHIEDSLVLTGDSAALMRDYAVERAH